jgi:hypothetical protein
MPDTDLDGAPLDAPTSLGAVRGAVFRVASKVLAHQIGDAWVRHVGETDAMLADLLRSNLPPMHWRPLESFIALMQRASERVDATQTARIIGRSTITATFPRFFGADPATLRPEQVLLAAEAYWSRYHQWSRVQIEDTTAAVHVVVVGGPGDEVVCALVAGTLQRITEMSGARAVTVDHPTCAHRGDEITRFVVTWDRT